MAVHSLNFYKPIRLSNAKIKIWRYAISRKPLCSVLHPQLLTPCIKPAKIPLSLINSKMPVGTFIASPITAQQTERFSSFFHSFRGRAAEIINIYVRPASPKQTAYDVFSNLVYKRITVKFGQAAATVFISFYLNLETIIPPHIQVQSAKKPVIMRFPRG